MKLIQIWNGREWIEIKELPLGQYVVRVTMVEGGGW